MQKLYTLNFYAALAVLAALLLCLFWSLMSTTFIDIPAGVAVVNEIALVLAFLPFNLLCYLLNKERKIRLPRSIPARVVKVSYATLGALFFLLFFIGIAVYHSAPIRPDNGLFIDKKGVTYTYEQFKIYRKWEFALMTTGSMCFLCSIVLLPFYDKEIKEHRFD